MRCSVYVGCQPLVYVEIFQFKNILKGVVSIKLLNGKCSIWWFFRLGFSKKNSG